MLDMYLECNYRVYGCIMTLLDTLVLVFVIQVRTYEQHTRIYERISTALRIVFELAKIYILFMRFSFHSSVFLLSFFILFYMSLVSGNKVRV